MGEDPHPRSADQGRPGLHRLPHHRRVLRPLPGEPVQGLLPTHHGRAPQRPALAPHLGRAAERVRLPLRQYRQDAHHPLQRRVRLPRALRGREQGPLHGRPLVFRRVGQGLGRARAEEAAAGRVQEAQRLQGAARRLRVGAARAPPFRRLRRQHGEVVGRHLPGDRAALPPGGLSRTPPALRSDPRYAEPYLKRNDIPIPRPSQAELELAAAAAQGEAAARRRRRPRFGRPGA